MYCRSLELRDYDPRSAVCPSPRASCPGWAGCPERGFSEALGKNVSHPKAEIAEMGVCVVSLNRRGHFLFEYSCYDEERT